MINTVCNLKCGHCAVFDNRFVDQYSGITNAGDVTRVLSYLDDNDIASVVVSGGEPTLSPWLPLVVSGVTATGRSCSLSTNATRLTKPLVQDLVDRGLGKVTVSLDGARAQTHDALRGRGSFVRTLDGLDLLVTMGLRVTVGVFLRKEVLADLADIGRICGALGVQAVSLLVPIERGRCHPGKFAIDSAGATDAKLLDAFQEPGVDLELAIMRPECDSPTCPSGSKVFGAIGGKAFPLCVYKGEAPMRVLLELGASS